MSHSDSDAPPRGLALRLALAEIRASRAFAVSFTLSLSLGLIGFLVLDAFKGSLASHLDARSKSILAADFAMSSRRPLTPEEASLLTTNMPAGSVTRREVGMFSMANSGDVSRLVELRAIDGAFPFYGDLGLRRQGDIQSVEGKDLIGTRNAWVYPEVLTQLGVDVGATLKIGESEFVITDVVDGDPSVSSIGMAIAPKIFIDVAAVEATGLVARGSRVSHSIFVKFDAATILNDPKAADQLEEKLRAAIPTRDVRLTTHREASEDLARMVTYLSDYLGLVALVALFLAGVGAAYLFRSFLSRRSRDIAVLMSLGAPVPLVRALYLWQLALLGLAGTALTVALSGLVLPLVPLAFGNLLPDGLVLTLMPESLAIASLMGIVGSILFCLPLVLRVGAVKPAELFQEAARPTVTLTPRAAAAWLPALVGFWGLAVWLAHSWVTGSLFVAIFLVAGAGIAALALGLLKALSRFEVTLARGAAAFELASLNLTRHKAASLASFLAIALGALLVNLVPQLRGALQEELASPTGSALPSLFLFDIQDEQLAPIKTKIQDLQADLAYASPLVRARLTHVNGEATIPVADGEEFDREEQRAGRMRNRTYNLTFRDGLYSSEALTDGRAFSGVYDWNAGKLPEISLEQRFAERMGLGIGDKMTFDVQGVGVEGEVVSLRRVKWTSFQPNFFVQFQPGVLNDAPKTFVAAIPNQDRTEKAKLQQALVTAFPNVSIIDVSAAIGRILEIVGQMSIAIGFMALLSLIAGAAVLFAIAHHQAAERRRDSALLKTLGMNFGAVRLMIATEFGFLGLMAGLTGAGLSIGASYVVGYVMFDNLWLLAWQPPVFSTIAIAAICIVTGLAATTGSLRAKPAELLAVRG